MSDENESNSDQESFEATKDTKMSESAEAHRDGEAFASGEGTGAPDLPEHDGIKSDSSSPAPELHGSLHGNWTDAEGNKEGE